MARKKWADIRRPRVCKSCGDNPDKLYKFKKDNQIMDLCGTCLTQSMQGDK